MTELTSAEARRLRAAAQHLEPMVRIGRGGLSPQVLAAIDAALTAKELIKVRFDELKEQRKELAPTIAAQTQSHLVTIVGHVAVLYRQRPAPAAEAEPKA